MTELKYFHISGDRFLYIFVKIVSSNIFQTFVFGADPQFLRVVDILWLLALCGICCEYFLPVFQFSLDFANLMKIFRFFFNLYKFVKLLLLLGFNSSSENLFLIHIQTEIHSCFLLVLMCFHFYI